MTKASILKQIRLNCLECSNGSPNEVDKCPMKHCPLYALRFGKDPEPRQLSEERKRALVERLAQAREKKQETV